MKIAIVGPGAMGCLFGAFLARSKEGHDVWLFDKQEERAKHIAGQGIKVEGVSGKFEAKVKATCDPKEIGVVDLALLCVKSYDTESATKRIKGLVGENTSVLTLQNGMGNLQTMSELVDEDVILGGVTNHGATTLGYGHIRHAGKGETVIGKLDGHIRGQVRDVAKAFNRAGIQARTTRDIRGLIWSKLIINVGINALTAVTHLNNGRLTEYEGTREVLRLAVTEAVRVARKKRIKLVYDDPIQKVESVCAATSGNISSMLQDALKNRRTEIDYINGAVVRMGKSAGVATPVNSVLTDLVKTIESSYAKQIPK